MGPFRIILLIALLFLIPAKGYAQCEAYWMDLAGKGEEEHLTLRNGWPIAQFANSFPHWEPGRYDVNGRYAGLASKSEFQWQPLSTPASVEVVGRVGGRPVSAVTYSSASGVLIWSRSQSSWCPVAILDGDETIVAGLSKPEVFMWRGTEILSQRIFYSGMGALQSSLFFAVVGGALTHLRQDDEAARTFINANKITISHRGGGFCRGALTWETQAWKGELSTEQVGTLRISYKVDRNRLVVESTSLLSEEAGKNCGQYSQ